MRPKPGRRDAQEEGSVRTRVWVLAGLAAVLAFAAVACRKSVTYPIYRRPVISSISVFPQVVAAGESTIVTVLASDPDGDSLVYDWSGYNGLRPKGAPHGFPYAYSTHNSAQVFYAPDSMSIWPDTAFVWCTVRDIHWGSASGHVLVFYQH